MNTITLTILSLSAATLLTLLVGPWFFVAWLIASLAGALFFSFLSAFPGHAAPNTNRKKVSSYRHRTACAGPGKNFQSITTN